MTGDANRRRRWWWAACVAGTFVVAAVVYGELARLQQGQLFAFSLPWEQPPTSLEVLDAHNSARSYLWPAFAGVGLSGIVVAYAAPKLRSGGKIPYPAWPRLAMLFLAAALADLTTTIYFFHAVGVDHELHPGIRMFGYAYGRTMGPVLGKMLQALGVLGLSWIFGRAASISVLVTASLLYGLAAMYNLAQW